MKCNTNAVACEISLKYLKKKEAQNVSNFRIISEEEEDDEKKHQSFQDDAKRTSFEIHNYLY